jgi:hypothetical protein
MTAARKGTHGGAAPKVSNKKIHVAADVKSKAGSGSDTALGHCLFTFVMPVFGGNQSGYFEVSHCLKSVLDQTNPNWEVIMLCDGTDPIMREVYNGAREDLGRMAGKIRYYELPHRGIRGGHHMIDFGVDQAHGEFICILNGDNNIEPDYIESMYDASQDIVTCWVEMHDLPGVILQGSAWRRGRMDRLNYAVRRSIAKHAIHGMHVDSDHDYFVSCYEIAQSRNGECRQKHVRKVLGHHR